VRVLLLGDCRGSKPAVEEEDKVDQCRRTGRRRPCFSASRAVGAAADAESPQISQECGASEGYAYFADSDATSVGRAIVRVLYHRTVHLY
jgi:hypothetical protein